DPAPSLIASGVMDAHDIRVVEPGDRPGLAEEPLHQPLAGIGLLEHLDRHIPIEPGIERQEDQAEPAIAQLLAELEPPQAAQGAPLPRPEPVDLLTELRDLRVERPH